MQGRHLIGLLLHQVRLQNIGKEVVIAIPLALVIERNDEQVAALQGFQHPFAIFLPGDGIAQRTAQPVENGGLQQEAADTFGLALQNLFDQIVQDKTVAAGESLDKTGACLLAPAWRRAANCRPAIQPSVRVSRAAISSAERFRPITWLRNSAASEGVKRRSAARTSVN